MSARGLAARASRRLVPIVAVLAIGIAPGPETSLLWTSGLTTALMPCITFVAVWIRWRPRNTAGLLGVTAVVVLAAVVILVLETALVAGPTSDLSRYFPFVIAPGALLFVTYLQLTLVWERAPFDRFGAGGGVLAGIASAIAAVVAYSSLVNWPADVAAHRPPHLFDPHGPIAGTSLISWLTVLAGWQVLVVVVWDGYPGRLLGRRSSRIALNNVVTLGATAVTYLVASAAGVSDPELAAVGACIVAGGRLPFSIDVDGVDSRGNPFVRTLHAFAWIVIVYVLLDVVAISSVFVSQRRELWIAVAGLNLVSGGVTYAASFVFARRRSPTPLADVVPETA